MVIGPAWHPVQIFRLTKRDPARAKRQSLSVARVIPILGPVITSTGPSRLKTWKGAWSNGSPLWVIVTPRPDRAGRDPSREGAGRPGLAAPSSPRAR